MSELKDYDIIEAMDDERLEKSESGKIQVTRVYIKAEADKVIAGLKECAKNLILDNYLKDKEIRHHKYKQCLALAKWCRLHDEFTQLESERLGLPQRAIFMEYRRKAMWWNKWHKKWHELAEKFKEAK